ncbi:endonuclease NucS domain-containing protein, partial [Vibrio parahaemolyticus]
IAVGVEFQVATRRIDVLLEHKVDNSLLVIELKSGKADFKVFGQLSMYMALVQREFPNRIIKGVIIAGEIEDSLSQAAET